MSKKKVTSQKCDSGHRRDACKKEKEQKKSFINVWSNLEVDVENNQPVPFNNVSAIKGFDNPGPGIFTTVTIPFPGWWSILYTTQTERALSDDVPPEDLPVSDIMHDWASYQIFKNGIRVPSTAFSTTILPGITLVEGNDIIMQYTNDVQVIGESIEFFRQGDAIQLRNVVGGTRRLNSSNPPGPNVSASLQLILLDRH